MQKLSVSFKNCYGIQSLEYDFEFGVGGYGGKAFAVYAPNGLMKTSFTRTFDKLARGEMSEEERYNRPSTCEVFVDGHPIAKEAICVLKSEIDIREDSPAITDILVNPTYKNRYDTILLELDAKKNKLFNAVQKATGVPKKDIEQTLLNDTRISDFADCVAKLKDRVIESEIAHISYVTLFDSKAVEVLKSAEFISNAKQFNTRYQELFSEEGTIYVKGKFNPAKADTSFRTLDTQGFFDVGHRLQMRGEATAIGKVELDDRLKKINERIDGDPNLKKIRTDLAKNAQTQALADLIEKLPAEHVEMLLDRLMPENQADFRLDLLSYAVQNSAETAEYLDSHHQTADEIKAIEADAAHIAPKWLEAVARFNDRFVDMPFTLSVANHTKAALGKEKARLKFTFNDGRDQVEWSRTELKTLSQGEKRALYLLNFIFEVEARSLAGQETLCVIDDPADSFDYKNKHAIVQYLDDLNQVPKFHQIILTHNFDFFRTLSARIAHRDRCLMANRETTGISLSKAEGINNYFVGVFKAKVGSNQRVMCATIPFTRNLIEYTKGDQDPDYFKLTCLLHWKKQTDAITVADYFDIYNRLFTTTHAGSNNGVKDMLYAEAKALLDATNHVGLDLEDKVLLSMAIRMRSEEFLVREMRSLKSDPDYWCESSNQFGVLLQEYKKLAPASPALRVLDKVSITVSSNIHLNSFMYEPILDLTIDHLTHLYREVRALVP